MCIRDSFHTRSRGLHGQSKFPHLPAADSRCFPQQKGRCFSAQNKKHVKVKNAYAQEIEKCEKLTSELSICHDTISNLRIENAKLIAKVEKSNECDDSIANLKNENASLIAKVDKLN